MGLGLRFSEIRGFSSQRTGLGSVCSFGTRMGLEQKTTAQNLKLEGLCFAL